jgi:hypothetical protein
MPHNVQRLAVGYVRSVSRDRGDGETEYVVAEIVICNATIQEKIDSGDLSELSAGYSSDVVNGRQTKIAINHIGLGGRDWARCGNACSIER